MKLLWTWVYKYLFNILLSVLLGKYSEVGLLDLLWAHSSEDLPSRRPQWLHFYIPTGGIWGFWFLFILTNTCYLFSVVVVFFVLNLIVAILKSVRWHLIVLLSFITPQMCSLVICMFPLENVYLNSLSDLESGCLFLLFCWKSLKCMKWERQEELPLFPRIAGYCDSRGVVCCR